MTRTVPLAVAVTTLAGAICGAATMIARDDASTPPKPLPGWVVATYPDRWIGAHVDVVGRLEKTVMADEHGSATAWTLVTSRCDGGEARLTIVPLGLPETPPDVLVGCFVRMTGLMESFGDPGGFLRPTSIAPVAEDERRCPCCGGLTYPR